MRDLFQEITDAISGKLAQGVRPWAQPWKAGATLSSVDTPHNIAGRSYRGANAFWLDLAGQARGYSRPLWMTYNQAKEKGGNVKKGEKGTTVFFWKFDRIQDEKTGQIEQRVMVKTYTVFNLDQTEGVDVPALRPTAPLYERVKAADDLADATGADIRYGGARAYFSPSHDFVAIPPREAFATADGLYSTLFHELGHWTGHKDRLAREYGKKFGDQAYAFEELVAELTAAFVCASLGFASIERDDHAAYIGHWLDVLAKDKRAFITAASAAQKAADYLLAFAGAKDESEPEELSEAA